MKVSLKCLSQFVDITNLTPEEIASKLTFSGVEVEDISYLAQGDGLVIGHVLKERKHPDSNHLHILEVDLGKEEGIKQIVCGAPNAKEGLKVIVALVGAKLPGGEIKKTLVRGVESSGMCCSLNELGVDPKNLSESQLKGIEELPLDAPVGERDVLGYLGLDDVVLNLKILANRPDLLGILNIAREVGSIFSRKTNIPTFETVANYKSEFEVGSETTKCTQFAIEEVKDLMNKESPRWLKEYLLAMGIRSIDALVDIGNYVMILTGQPLHMYDLDKLPKHSLIVKDDHEENFTALDGKVYKIQKGDIVITSENKVMCLGGVIGALEASVDANTRNLAIESASFDGAAIRRTSNRLGLVSESSLRFMKGTNHFQSEFVLDFATKLIRQICGTKHESEIVEYLGEEKERKVIASSVLEINQRLGTEFTNQEINDVLERLNFIVDMNEEGHFKVIVPAYRLDIFEAADLSEEVIRILGYEHVKAKLPSLRMTIGKRNERLEKSKVLTDYLLSNGLHQCLTYTLVSKNVLNQFNYLTKNKAHKVLNPLTDEREYVRLSVLPSLLESVSYNVARQMKNLALFEISDIITQSNHQLHLSIVLCGEESLRGELEKRPVDFYTLKGLLRGMMEILGIEKNRYHLERLITHKEEFHPGKSATIKVANEIVGVIGELHPNEIIKRDLGQKNKVVALELRLDSVFALKTSLIKMREISKYPFVNRDIALLVDRQIEVRDLLKSINKIGKDLVIASEVFDVYEGENIEPDKKSVAISISYRANDHTLVEKEVSELEAKIKSELNRQFKAVVRG
ncbi:MAG: phenylalanine--tRNA ligase subunit beta [Bacilli bacterium]|jgi:phenylalanyl-tRNA synthetase beta chain|nr:phenylalanine--tRNA ligase subunit beta [Bacilli bacterium]